MIQLLIRLHLAVAALTAPSGPEGGRAGAGGVRRARGDRGQATTEYALVLLAAALVALLVVGWATAGGGAEKIGHLFNRVIDAVIDKV
jgi:hypothetical protein